MTHALEAPYFFRMLRGSTNGIRVQNEVWFLCHMVFMETEKKRLYYHLFVVLDADTMEIRGYTAPFTMEGEAVEYTCGFVYEKDAFLIGYSVMDRETRFLSVTREEVETWMI